MRLASAMLAALCCCASGRSAPAGGGGDTSARVQMEEQMIPSADEGIQLYVRSKHPAGMQSFSPDRVVLFVHGSTYPAETSFDLPLGGTSWMDFIAQRGFDVWLVDLRGYGRSTRPPQMDEPPAANPPLVRTAIAVKDVGGPSTTSRTSAECRESS